MDQTKSKEYTTDISVGLGNVVFGTFGPDDRTIIDALNPEDVPEALAALETAAKLKKNKWENIFEGQEAGKNTIIVKIKKDRVSANNDTGHLVFISENGHQIAALPLMADIWDVTKDLTSTVAKEYCAGKILKEHLKHELKTRYESLIDGDDASAD